ncbi:MAG: CRISPR-associated endonuclease Cas1 [Moraxella sp.]|nr:CRISPR-associated endonuclease Cas1 [Moraxella sp.]
MVAYSQTLDWLAVDVQLMWRVPKPIKRTDAIYFKLWGLIQTVNTPSSEIEQALACCQDRRKQPILAQLLQYKQQHYPSDNFPLIAFHPTKGSYRQQSLKTSEIFELQIVFGGEYLHLAKDWLAWFEIRLGLENTGFEFVRLGQWHEYRARLPVLDLNQVENTQEQTMFIELPANISPSKQLAKDMERHSPAYVFGCAWIACLQKRLKQWFVTQHALIDEWFGRYGEALLHAPLCGYGLHDSHQLQSVSKSHARKHPNAPTAVQFHHGVAGWLTLKGLWTQLEPMWDIFRSIHLLGQRTQINGLGYLLTMEQAPHQPSSLMQRHFLSHARIRAATSEVLYQYDLEPEWDNAGQLMHEDSLSEWIFDELYHRRYAPSPTAAFLIPKAHGGYRRIEQLSQKDMIVHRLIFYVLAPMIDRYQSPLSLGYRKGYSREMARDEIRRLMDLGFAWVIEADIEDFFNSVPLDRLWEQLSLLFAKRETDTIELLQQLMQVPFELMHKKTADGKQLHKVIQAEHNNSVRTQGLMQGSPLSPILANLYLSQLDERINRDNIAFVRYADDVLIFCRSQHDADTMLHELDSELDRLGLNLALAKTQIRRVSDGFEFLGYRFDGEGSQDKAIVPILKQKKPIFISGDSKYLGVNGGALEIRIRLQKPAKPTKSKQIQLTKNTSTLLQVVPLRRISQLIILGNHSLSSPLLSACAKENVSVHFVNQWGFQVGTMTPSNASYYVISAKQYHRHQSLSANEILAIASDIVSAKINNYQTWIINSYRKGDADTLKKLTKLKDDANAATDSHSLMGYEGMAAKLCFARLQQCFIPEQQAAFSSKRRSRGGQDRLNSLLNFGYYWLFTRISALVHSHGLNPYLSFLHTSEQSYETLVYDLMEMFRVQVDKTVLRLINRRQIVESDFHLHEQKGWRLNTNALHLYSNQLQATFTSKIHQTYLEDIILMQVRTVQNWATDGSSLIWFYWCTHRQNFDFYAPDEEHVPMTIDESIPQVQQAGEMGEDTILDKLDKLDNNQAGE